MYMPYTDIHVPKVQMTSTSIKTTDRQCYHTVDNFCLLNTCKHAPAIILKLLTDWIEYKPLDTV